MQATRKFDFTLTTGYLAVALELSGKTWKLALTDGKVEKPAIYNAAAERAGARLAEANSLIERMMAKCGIDDKRRVCVICEAGQDGHWITRALRGLGYCAMTVDPTSIPVQRQARRAKTDRLDAIRLVMCLLAWMRGERGHMQPVHEPTTEAEDQRCLARERGRLQKEIGQHNDRIRKLLRTVGSWESVDGGFEDRFRSGAVRCYDGSALPSGLSEGIERECVRLELARQQFAALDKMLAERLPAPVRERIEVLQRLKGVGPVGATRLVLELFWRNFDNRRQVGACVGLVPQPYDSGQSRVDQGISKQGNRRVRALLIELSWLWLRYQSGSALAKWFALRTSGNATNKRGKRIAIVAVARRLVIALWRYLKDGVIPEGALIKA